MLMSYAEAIAMATEKFAACSASPKIDAQVLLQHVLNKPLSYLYSWPQKQLSKQQFASFQSLIEQRQKPTPIAYLVGYKEFWSRNFKVSADTLIPRADTELLIEKALTFIQNKPKYSVLDLGTGTGCIAITLKLECPAISVFAIDNRLPTLKIAQENAHQYKADIHFLHSHWFEKIPTDIRFDLIVSNPPYIHPQDKHLHQGDLVAEPINALISEDEGMSDIKKILLESKNYLKPNGILLFEHGYNQKQAVYDALHKNGYINISQHHDYNGLPRVSCGVIP